MFVCPIYDNDGAASYKIGKIYDNDGTSSYQIGKIYDNDGTYSHLIYNAEETLTKSVTSGTTGRDGSYGAWGAIHIELPAGETFRIDNINWYQRIFTNVDIDLYVNGTEVWNVNRTVTDGYYTYDSGAISGTYTAVAGTTAIMLRIRGWDSSGSWHGSFTNTATITYTIGV